MASARVNELGHTDWTGNADALMTRSVFKSEVRRDCPRVESMRENMLIRVGRWPGSA